MGIEAGLIANNPDMALHEIGRHGRSMAHRFRRKMTGSVGSELAMACWLWALSLRAFAASGAVGQAGASRAGLAVCDSIVIEARRVAGV